MEYPDFLRPTTFETISIGDMKLDVPKCEVLFEKWVGPAVKETFGGKPIIDYYGSPVFAELAIMQAFKMDGWEARWVATYGKRKPIYLASWKDGKYREQQDVPFEDGGITELLSRISLANAGRYSGCWDVVAKKDANLLFAESKRSKKDSIRPSQKSWFAAALACGLEINNFLLVQWDFRRVQIPEVTKPQSPTRRLPHARSHF